MLDFAVEGIGRLDHLLRRQAAQVDLFDGDNLIGALRIGSFVYYAKATNPNLREQAITRQQHVGAGWYCRVIQMRLGAGETMGIHTIVSRAADCTIPCCRLHTISALLPFIEYYVGSGGIIPQRYKGGTLFLWRETSGRPQGVPPILRSTPALTMKTMESGWVGPLAGVVVQHTYAKI